jgi:all-trans-8'-apo-beta-carotenal 15,15'-oxygenase
MIMDSIEPTRLARAEMLRLLQGALNTVETEYSDHPLPVEGELPADLDGVLFRNGGGRFERGGLRYGHPFDGDGHILRIDISAGSARYTNRFVRTREYLDEESAGRLRYRGFGTNLPGGLAGNLLRPFKNAANTNVVWHGGRLLALWEGGLPHRLDPRTLATLGPDDFQGRLRRKGRWMTTLLPFSAHPRIDTESGELINFGVAFGRPHRLMIYRVSADGCMSTPEAHDLPRFSFVHDIAVTRRWICVLLPRADFRVGSALLGLRTAVASLRLATEQPMQAMLIPRDGGPTRLIEAVPGFVFHIAQAFDDDDGKIQIDAVRFRDYPAFEDLAGLFAEGADSRPRLERLTLDPERGGCTLRSWSERGFELPTTAPGAFGAQHRFIHGIGAPGERGVPFFTAIQRLDTETGQMQVLDLGRDLPGEPVLAPGCGAAAGSGDGWLLSLVNRIEAGRSELLVLRAADLSVQATLRLPHAVPLGFHGCWVERCALPASAPKTDRAT